MSDHTDTGALRIAERSVAMAIDAGASEAEAVVVDSVEALTRFANNEIHQSVAESDVSVSLRFVDGRRVAVASGNRTDDRSLRELAARAGEMARLQPENEAFTSLPTPAPISRIDGAWAAATADADPESRANAAGAVIDAARGVGAQAFGLCSTASEEVAVASSLGVAAAEARSRSQVLSVMMDADGGTGYSERVAVDVADIDAAAVGAEAADRTARMRDPIELPAGDYPVVLEAFAVVDIADWIGYTGFSALAVEEERSFFEAGRRIGSDLVTLTDDAADPLGTPASFDYEGMPKRRVPLIENGICREVVHDAQTAARAGVTSTGHGLPAPNPWGPFPLHPSLAAGTTPDDELIAPIDRGLLVTHFHYTNVVHPKQVVITGMTRDGLFLIEDGQVVAPVRNLRFTQSYLEAIANVEAVGIERRAVEGFLGTAVVPAMRLSSFSFTGTTEH